MKNWIMTMNVIWFMILIISLLYCYCLGKTNALIVISLAIILFEISIKE